MEGLSGETPQPGQLAAVLCRKDALVYCGHGSGSAYISGDDIEKLRVRAVPLLLGCSSGQLVRLGRSLDPLGTAQSYLMASAAALLGFLWPVSDKVGPKCVAVVFAVTKFFVFYSSVPVLHFSRRCNVTILLKVLFGKKSTRSTSFVDPDPYWIRIRDLCGSGSVHSKTHLTKKLFWCHYFLIGTGSLKNVFLSLKLFFLFFSFQN